MSDNVKTLIFAGIAVAVTIIAVVTYPRQARVAPKADEGKVLFADFTDPDQASRIVITHVTGRARTGLAALSQGEESADVRVFELAREGQRWMLPSHDNYPVAAEQRIRQAATSLIGLEVIRVASEFESHFRQYGVIEPKVDEVAAGQDGVGKLVAIKDENANHLARLIIGYPVRGQKGQRFARVPGQSRVYTVELDPQVFSVKFEDWIRPRLLNLRPTDISQFSINDYSAQQRFRSIDNKPEVLMHKRLKALIGWDLDASEGFDPAAWNLVKLVEFSNGEYRETQLADDEELDRQRIEQLAQGLSSLGIVSAKRKPIGLGADVAADPRKLLDPAIAQSLAGSGFYTKMEDGQPGVVAASGELLVRTHRWVVYHLRFGSVAGFGGDGAGGKLNRFLMIQARLADDAAFGGEDVAQEDINERKEQAAATVEKLNEQFGDWYFIISDDTFRQIRLGRSDLIREKESAVDEGFNIDAFRELQRRGIGG
jgi:hypothetical protein